MPACGGRLSMPLRRDAEGAGSSAALLSAGTGSRPCQVQPILARLVGIMRTRGSP